MTISIYDFSTPVFLPVGPCAPVLVCLKASWAAKTVTGLSTVTGIVGNDGRWIGRSALQGLLGVSANPRGADQFQYPISIDDAQFLNDPDTDLPWVLDCSDIVNINPYTCGIDSGDDEADRLAYYTRLSSGADGDVTNPSTLTADKNYNNLVIQVGHTWDPAGSTVSSQRHILNIAGSIFNCKEG